jgi:hypothetical protein
VTIGMRGCLPCRIALWSLALLAALAGLFLVLRWVALREARKTQARAELFISRVLKLEVGRATRSQVDQLAEEFGAEHDPSPWLVASPPPAYPVPPPTAAAGMVYGCMGFSEVFRFRFRNSPLHYLGLAPLSGLGVGLRLYRGILCDRGISIGSGTGRRTVAISIHENWPSGVSWFSAHLAPSVTYIDFMGPLPDDVRRGLYSFNFDCFSRIGGCRRSEDLLPWIWAQRGRRGFHFPTR